MNSSTFSTPRLWTPTVWVLFSFVALLSACTRKSESCQPRPGEDCLEQNDEESCGSKNYCQWTSGCNRTSCPDSNSTGCINSDWCEWDEAERTCLTIAGETSPDACRSLGLGGSPSECAEKTECYPPRCISAEFERLCNNTPLSECDSHPKCEVVVTERPIYNSQ